MKLLLKHSVKDHNGYILRGDGSGKIQDTVLEIGERAEIPDSVWKIRDTVSKIFNFADAVCEIPKKPDRVWQIRTDALLVALL